MILITSGCSFTDTGGNPFLAYNSLEDFFKMEHPIATWPLHLFDYMKTNISEQTQLINLGLGSQGNGLIGRKVRWIVNELLDKKYDPSSIIVGIMWSGFSRGEMYVDHNDHRFLNTRENTEGWIVNPVNVPYGDNTNNWFIVNSGWKIKEARSFYKFFSDEWLQLKTLDEILYTQYFLQCKNIKYFMCNFMPAVFSNLKKQNVDYLYDQIDKSYWLPVDSMTEWLMEKGYLEASNVAYHPTFLQHKKFTSKVIVPFIKTKYKL